MHRSIITITYTIVIQAVHSTIQQDRPRSLSSLYLLEEAQDRASLLADGFSAQESDDLARCAEWTGSFPLQKVRKRHRVEAICPMLAPSIQDRGLHFSLANPGKREPDLTELDEILREASDCFENEVQASDPRLRCLVLVLPGVRGGRLLEATEPTRQIKNELLERGILVGEFFPSCPFATTFNPKLFALRSPVPMYVLRTFIESDWRFICQVPAWKRTYRERFGDPPRRLRHLGGPIWRFKEKLRWRWQAIRNKFEAPSKGAVPPREDA